VAEPERDFAGLLRQLRTEARLTQEELAEAAGISPRSVSDLERGVARTSHKDTAELLAGALNLAGPVRGVFVAAARGRVPAADVLAARHGQQQGSSATAATRDGTTWPSGLPVPLTGLVGREQNLKGVTALVADNRLVTLVGSGGVGKTRLAIEAAAASAPRFADGVDLVDLSGVPDQQLVWAAVAQTVGVEQRADADLAERLAGVLRAQDRLLVLDNCEHLLAECAAVARRLLGSCPEVHILATSRERLSVPGEVTWRVPSLTFPWPDRPPALEELERFGAMALFAARARAARPGLVIAADDIAPLSSICFRLDGIPLAVELAAARVSALSIQEIAEHLDDRFVLLTRAVGGPARHQTLRASVDWSHQLLSHPEQAIFRRLAAFAGGWSVHAADTVCTGPPIGPGQVVRLLAALVDKSLVQAEDTVTGTRYRLLEAIKSFAYEQLVASGELDDIRARHATYFADLGEHVPARLHGADQGYWATCLGQEQANLRAARIWCAEDPARAELGLAMASGLGEYWLIRGLLDEGTDWLNQAIEPAPRPGRARAAALGWLAVIASLRHQIRRAGELFEDSTAMHERAGDHGGHAQFLALTGLWRANQGDSEGAAEAVDRAIALAGRWSQDRYVAALALMMGSLTALLTADTALAQARATESLNLSTEIGDRRWAGYARCVLADCLSREGNPHEALALLRVCVADFESLLDRWGLLISANSAVLAHAALGDWDQATFAAGVADSLSERIGGRPYPALQAAVEAVSVTAAAELGEAATARREAGRTAGRSDQIAAALGLATQPAPSHQRDDLPLTMREREITLLVAAGLTNRQVAERLCIARRTVDTHLAHILAKLGCSNRTQVADLTSSRRPPATFA
jgi:predicted ATPase/DNA-binding CsgD family transcriptional regulator